jgi:hexosaminidase
MGCKVSGTDYLGAIIDEVKVFNKALSDAEVSSLYQAYPTPPPTPTPSPPPIGANVIPVPVTRSSVGGTFALTSSSDIYVEPSTSETTAIGQYLANKLNPSTGFGIQVFSTTGEPAAGNIYLTTVGGSSSLGTEGYELYVTSSLIKVVAYQPCGLFRGIQTIRQLFPDKVEKSTVQAGPWEINGGTITDKPRFSCRATMLDVSRHFFSADIVKTHIDRIAYYKMNYIHLHLSDDQGWRIYINTWPNCAIYGGSTQVGGGPGGYYTQAQYSDIVSYAQARYITIIPEIDSPGHTNACLASYAELNCNNVAPPLYTGTDVGFSSLCISKPITYTFMNDVHGELAGLSPGPYLHVGGDEASSTPLADYISFINQVEDIVANKSKYMVGWEEIAQTTLYTTSVAQHWYTASLAQNAKNQGCKVLMSPASKAYLDMKYNSSSPIGLSWAGYTDTMDAYTWDPATQVSGVGETDVLGLDCPLWTETVVTESNIEYLVWPRLPGHAEIAWSPQTGRSWDEYKYRLATHGPRMANMGIEYYADPVVPW